MSTFLLITFFICAIYYALVLGFSILAVKEAVQYFTLDIEAILQSLLQKIEQLEARIINLEAENAFLINKKRATIAIYPHHKNRIPKKKKIRKPTDRKAGSQPGHEGTTFKCRSAVDETIKSIIII